MRIALLAVFIPAILCGQQSQRPATLLGRVIDATDTGAVAHATVSIVNTNIEARTDGWGNFRLDGIRPGPHELVIRALGYAKLTESEDFTAGENAKHDFTMLRVPHVLTQMVIEGRSMRVPRGMEEVYRRGGLGFGHFITREQIDSLNPVDLKTMLDRVPGVQTNDRGVTFTMCGNPQLWIDGQRVTKFARHAQPDRNSMGGTVPDPFFLNEFLTGILPTQVQAMEVYTSHVTVPGEFMDGNPCGVVAIWTKRGP